MHTVRAVRLYLCRIKPSGRRRTSAGTTGRATDSASRRGASSPSSDPTLVSYYGERVEKMSPEEREWAEEKLGLNDKISVQYARWIRQAFHGNFGISYKYKMDVLEVLKSRIGNTLDLGGIGFLIIFFGGNDGSCSKRCS